VSVTEPSYAVKRGNGLQTGDVDLRFAQVSAPPPVNTLALLVLLIFLKRRFIFNSVEKPEVLGLGLVEINVALCKKT